jgi:hypothetical protein
MMKSFRIKWKGVNASSVVSDNPLEVILSEIRSAIQNQTVILQRMSELIPADSSVTVEQIRLLCQSISDNTSSISLAAADIKGLVEQIVENPFAPVSVFLPGTVLPLQAGFSPLNSNKIMSGLTSSINGIDVPVEIKSVKTAQGVELFDYVDWEYYIATGDLYFSFLKLPPFVTGAVDSLVVTLVQSVSSGTTLTFNLPVNWPLDNLKLYRNSMFAAEITGSAPVDSVQTTLRRPNFEGFFGSDLKPYYSRYRSVCFQPKYFGLSIGSQDIDGVLLYSGFGGEKNVTVSDFIFCPTNYDDLPFLDYESGNLAFVDSASFVFVFGVDIGRWKLGADAVFSISFVVNPEGLFMSKFFLPELFPSKIVDTDIFGFNTFPGLKAKGWHTNAKVAEVFNFPVPSGFLSPDYFAHDVIIPDFGYNPVTALAGAGLFSGDFSVSDCTTLEAVSIDPVTSLLDYIIRFVADPPAYPYVLVLHFGFDGWRAAFYFIGSAPA